MRKAFLAPGIAAIIILAAVYLYLGPAALLVAMALAILEVTLSFDNAVVNAKVLARMPPRWQKRFLTWGMLISVGGVRLILPLLIVSVVAFISPITITYVAFTNPVQYAALIGNAGSAIKAFGGMFLLLVALDYFFDSGKTVHWIKRVERRLASWGQIKALEIGIALMVLLGVTLLIRGNVLLILQSGIVGIVLFILARSLSAVLGAESEFTRTGLALFIYVNILDATLSLDGVVGAFALTTALPIIVAGLGIGAYFVRSLTVEMVRGRTLERFIYLEHGAHWAILGLAVCMIAGLVLAVPEWLIASIGLFFIILAYASSRREEVRIG